jgi:ribosome recycling factor
MLSYARGEIPSAQRLVALQEISSVLRPDGRLIVIEGFTDPHRQRIETVRKIAEQANLRLERVSGWLNKVMSFVPASSD